MNMRLKSIKSVKDLRNKLVLVRVDFNVPIKSGKVLEDMRLVRSLGTVNYLLRKGARVVLMSHLGRPAGKRVLKYSLRPVGRHLSKLIKKPVEFNNAKVGSNIFYKKIEKLAPGEIMMIENTRFYPGDKNNSLSFAKALARNFDYYVNDAFSASHRAHASVVGVAKYLPALAGLNLLNEVDNLSKILKNPKQPLVVVIGGAKISTKIKVINQYLPKTQCVLLGGGLVANILKAGGSEVGSSLVDKKGLGAAKALLKHLGKKICMPSDLVLGDAKTFKKIKTVNIEDGARIICKKGQAIYDIGPKTVRKYKKYFKNAKTIIWNGPLGLVEVPVFSHSTKNVAKAIAKSKAKSYIGGGETLMILNKLGLIKKMTFVSTGGGAMLEFLEGKQLPGLKILKK